MYRVPSINSAAKQLCLYVCWFVSLSVCPTARLCICAISQIKDTKRKSLTKSWCGVVELRCVSVSQKAMKENEILCPVALN